MFYYLLSSLTVLLSLCISIVLDNDFYMCFEFKISVLMFLCLQTKFIADCFDNSRNFLCPFFHQYILLKVEIKGKMYVVINIYVPNKDKYIVKFLNDLLMML